MAITASVADINSIYKFLEAMGLDSKGAVAIYHSYHANAIKLLLDKKPFALELYSEFIKTSKRPFPSISSLIETINNAERRCKSFEQKSHYFCMDMWLYIYH
jgi:hypothetical protein